MPARVRDLPGLQRVSPLSRSGGFASTPDLPLPPVTPTAPILRSRDYPSPLSSGSGVARGCLSRFASRRSQESSGPGAWLGPGNSPLRELDAFSRVFEGREEGGPTVCAAG